MSSSHLNRAIVLDDTDSSITYIGPAWTQENGTIGAAEGFGDFEPYMHTVHKTSADGSVLLDFNGLLNSFPWVDC